MHVSDTKYGSALHNFNAMQQYVKFNHDNINYSIQCIPMRRYIIIRITMSSNLQAKCNGPNCPNEKENK